MRNLAHKLFLVWLLLGLAVAPLQAQVLGAGNRSGCPIQQAGPQQDAAGAPLMTLQDQEPASCAQCQDQGCDHAHCEGATCATVQFPSSVGDIQELFDGPRATLSVTGYSRSFASLPPAPLYRPPV